ncbi:MAG: bacillithiol biosynthesis cysteine-adding enzyme BshC [Bryobacteraceae bacterium]
MEPACLRYTELPHTSRLFSDFLYHRNRVKRFYNFDHVSPYPEDRRPALIQALQAQNTNTSALQILAQPGAVAMVTGQQVGLFSGPAYTIYKALTAAKLARQANEDGKAAVPVFWLATEDHDFAEVNHAYAFNKNHETVTFRLDQVESIGQPVGQIPVVTWPIEELRHTLQDFPFAAEVMSLVEETYTPGASMGEAFRKLIERLLAPYGFLFIDPMHPATRALAAPMLGSALEIGPELNKLLLQRNRDLEAAGYHSQVHVDERTSLFFLHENGRRVPLRDLDYSQTELAGRAQDLSPNALLRPVVQDYMLPTAAYVGGPAELAYFAQSQVLYERLLGRMPKLESRSGFTLLDVRSQKLMDRYGLRVPDFFQGQAALSERLAAALVPASLEQKFDDAAASTSQLLDRLHESVTGFDTTLGDALLTSRRKILHQITKTRAKIARKR